MPLMIALILTLLAPSGQRIETQYPDRGRVTRVETAIDRLTVLELAEPVTLAAAGSPLFRIERRENKVFIQPLEDGASTNLFVWTASGRWTYELTPARSPETAHFAIDQEIAAWPVPAADLWNEAVSDTAAWSTFAEELLFQARPIRVLDAKVDFPKVQATVTDVLRKDDQLFIRYVLDNRSARPYIGAPPEVFLLESASSPISLHTLRYSQIGPDLERRIRRQTETPVDILDCEWPPEAVPSGEAAAGVLTLHLPETSAVPVVLRFVFPAAGEEPVSLTLVL